MASRAAKVRAGLTAIGVVLGITFLIVVAFFVIAMGVNIVGNALVGGDDTGTAEAPDIEFETTLENETVVVRHAGGPATDASAIAFALNGDDRGTWEDQSTNETGEIDDGDTVTLYGVTPDDELAIRWTDGESSELLVSTTLGTDST